MSVQNILSETHPPPNKKKPKQHFLIAKKKHENNKNQAKNLKCTEKILIFRPPPSHRKCMVCTLVKMLTFMDGPLVLF